MNLVNPTNAIRPATADIDPSVTLSSADEERLSRLATAAARRGGSCPVAPRLALTKRAAPHTQPSQHRPLRRAQHGSAAIGRPIGGKGASITLVSFAIRRRCWALRKM
jgi:hypothetical protein